MTFYVFDQFINADDSNTVLMAFGEFWDGDAGGGGGGTTIPAVEPGVFNMFSTLSGGIG